MKLHLLLFIILIASINLIAQTPTVASLQATGSNIPWYKASTGETALTTSTLLVNDTHYFASQTINCTESTTRLEVTATIS